MRKVIRVILACLLLATGVLAYLHLSVNVRCRMISGNIVDLVSFTVYSGSLVVKDGKIVDIVKDNKNYATYIIPGLVDAHVHVESSMLVPSEFARLAVLHGTVATVSDPHEIANVLGAAGIDYMIKDAKRVPFKFYFGASSCVPATSFETAGAILNSSQIDSLLSRKDIKYLSEMMNYPGVINSDPEVMAKIAIAKKYGKPIDGHAPGLLGEELIKYIQAGITSDHESYLYEESLQEGALGACVLIREGSAAKNFDTLYPILEKYPDLCMFCSDDKHPDDLVKGHINQMVKKALDLGYDKMLVLKCASYNPVRHYGLDVGLLQKGDNADFVVIDDFKHFNILKTYINGRLVAKNGRSLLNKLATEAKNNFSAHKKTANDFKIKNKGGIVRVIQAIDGQLVTKELEVMPKVAYGYVVSDPDKDILKIAVVNRYRDAPPAVALVKNFGLKKGAIASSFAHDSHNIIAVGVSDEDIARAVNLVIQNHGGLAIAYDDYEDVLELPVAGLMSIRDGYAVAQKYSQMTDLVKKLWSNLRAPYMTLSFMALLVIPEIKLSDQGLFDGSSFKFTDLFVVEKSR
jgi:adenine deaminase